MTTASPLADSPSPYLRQHAAQPVQWLPWSEAALARAQQEDKPVLLSIGYAACHWCHVMARESFEDAATAASMNEGFVNIKVDREQQPELDQLYQLTHQLLRRGGGGWPLTVFLSPQGVPFYSGTYFPAQAQADLPAFKDVLATVRRIWHERRADLARQDQALLAALQARQPRPDARAVLDAAVRDRAVQSWASAYDATHGGFGGAPRFPHPTDLGFLLRRGRDEGDAAALGMALHSLRAMAAGGLYDQLGGGFFRYSTDVAWQLPHFEKMLCDNALLLGFYAEALTVADEPLLRRVVDDTVAWLRREMAAPDGGFCTSLAAEDAQGHEGRFYVWQREPLRLALTPNEWDVCAAHWGLVDAPAFEGRDWHLRIARDGAALAGTLQRPAELVDELIASARPKLLAERNKRPAPGRDDKVLTGWNALLVTALARAGAVCARPDWLALARETLGWLQRERWSDGRLLSLPGQPAVLDDHAFLLEAVLALHAVDPRPGDLGFATDLAEALLLHFEDASWGGFFFTRHDAPPLIHRLKTGLDGATPSGNGTAALALQALGRLTHEVRWFAAAERCVQVFAATVADDPASHTRLLQAALSA